MKAWLQLVAVAVTKGDLAPTVVSGRPREKGKAVMPAFIMIPVRGKRSGGEDGGVLEEDSPEEEKLSLRLLGFERSRSTEKDRVDWAMVYISTAALTLSLFSGIQPRFYTGRLA